MHINFPWRAGIGSCCGVQLVECWMKAWMFFWDVFIGPLVKGSNRYHDVRAGFCHDTSAIRHEEALFLLIMGRVRYVCGKHSEMGTSVVRTKLKKLVGNQQNTEHSKCWAIRERGGEGLAKMKSFHCTRAFRKENIHLWMAICQLSGLSPVARVKIVNKTPQRTVLKITWLIYSPCHGYLREKTTCIHDPPRLIWWHVCPFTWADTGANLTSARTASTSVYARLSSISSGISAWNRSRERGPPIVESRLAG